KYEYMGDPDLKNERSLDASLSLTYNLSGLKMTAEAKYFRVYNYIIGKVDPSMADHIMNVAYAQGIKRYVNLTYGELYNTSLSAEYPIFDFLSVDGSVSYHRGKDNHHNNLPMISPLAYTAGIHFQKEGY